MYSSHLLWLRYTGPTTRPTLEAAAWLFREAAHRSRAGVLVVRTRCSARGSGHRHVFSVLCDYAGKLVTVVS